MNKLATTLVFALILVITHQASLRNRNPVLSQEAKDGFETALRFTREVNDRAAEIGGKFFDSLAHKGNLMPIADFIAAVEKLGLYAADHNTDHPFGYNFDTNGDGQVDRHEAQLAFRNMIISIASEIAFEGSKFQLPEGPLSEAFNRALEFTVERYQKTQKIVNHLFDLADANKSGTLSTEEFLSQFKFAASDHRDAIIKKVNPTGADVITREQAFTLFGLLVLDANEKTEGAQGAQINV